MPETETIDQPADGVDKSAGRVRRMFASISPRYDFLNHALSGGCDYYWRRRTVRWAPPAGSAPVLDVCTGTGDLAWEYQRVGGNELPVVGTDFTHEMLTRAVDKYSSTRGAAPVFLEADTLRLPFPDNHFQIVSVGFGLRNLAETMAGLQEMVRVCQPGGRVVILEFSLPTNRLLRSSYRAYFRYVLPRIGQLLARNADSAYHYLPQSVAEFPQGDELASMMADSGLGDVEWRTLTFGVATYYCGVKRTA